jgi:type II secretory ATPase GspE/PulE/Tfp pilus assembly ATPase PilB-like protein
MTGIDNNYQNSSDRSKPAQGRLIDVLLSHGALSQDNLSLALEKLRESGDTRGTVTGPFLIKLGLIKEEELTRAQATVMGVGYATPELFAPENSGNPEVLALISPAIANQFVVYPIGRSSDGKRLRVVASQWTQPAFDALQQMTKEYDLRVEPMLGTERLVRAAIKAYYDTSGSKGDQAPKAVRHSVPAVVDTATSAVRAGAIRPSEVLTVASAPVILPPGSSPLDPGADGGDIDGQEFSVDQPIIIQFVNKIVSDAIVHRASDVHFEPRRDRLEIKYRVDGSLHTVDEVPKTFQSACVSRIKVMAEMNIAERRVPQDGRISVRVSGRTVDIRVSSLPTQFGEAVVMRILDRTSMSLDINDLGFEERNLRTLRQVISKPHGIFLATGPTGSGKTTTLYAAIQAIKSPDINIITCEDPIEYDLDGIRQSNVNEKAGLTFAKQLRAILRQDPDVIYVGEIRDPETAEIAFRAALTGHLVFSTLHCNDSAGAITRLLNMGVDPFLIASSVIGAMAQRLVRKVCPNCAKPYQPRPEELHALGIDPKIDDLSRAKFVKGVGCTSCDKTGYRGRCSIQELMIMDESIRQLTLEKETATKIRMAAMAAGNNPMIPMRRDGAVKVMHGITTFDEIQRRVFISEEE